MEDFGSPKLDQRAIETASDGDLSRILVRALFARAMRDKVQELEMVRQFSPGLRMFWGTDVMDGEVQNGGFLQFFWNSSANYFHEAVNGFRMIGASEYAGLAEEALATMEKDWPKLEPLWIEQTLGAFSEAYEHSSLDALDNRWYALSGFEDRRIRYIRAHADEFVLE